MDGRDKAARSSWRRISTHPTGAFERVDEVYLKAHSLRVDYRRDFLSALSPYLPTALPSLWYCFTASPPCTQASCPRFWSRRHDASPSPPSPSHSPSRLHHPTPELHSTLLQEENHDGFNYHLLHHLLRTELPICASLSHRPSRRVQAAARIHAHAQDIH